MANIWQAAKEGDVGEVEWLLGQDPDLLNAKFGLGWTLLMAASPNGHVGVVELLLDRGADANAKSNCGWTALMLASHKGHVGVVRRLLDAGAAINERGPGGRTALFYACLYGPSPVVRVLLERGACPTIAHDQGSNPLMGASFEGHLEVVRLLLAHPSAQVTINHRDQEGTTALWLACLRGHGGVVRALLESGADPTIPTAGGPYLGSTPLIIACWQDHVGVVRFLLDHLGAKATVNHRDVHGQTALLKACCMGRGEMARVLLESGADSTIADGTYGITPMALAKADPTGLEGVSAEGRRQCVAALEVRTCLSFCIT
jgi:uncharacterized protein